ncbi:MAG: hypothetical protein MUF07_08815 [Steroidobacteraceae bacterium]|jgi:uncharacterized lipoprotein|nr:hypothetical protein [Steroidobacteraceae bacterium]
MTKPLSLSLLLVASALLAGCGSVFKATCARPEDYATAVDNGPLKVPAGLQGPDTRSALSVPPLQEPERPRSADEPCLDAPPRYSGPAPAKPAA